MKLIDKDAVIAEINRVLKSCDRNEITIGRYALVDLRDFLDTLEVKEINMEEKATQLSQKYFPDEENIWARANIEALKCKSACMEMAEWLKE